MRVVSQALRILVQYRRLLWIASLSLVGLAAMLWAATRHISAVAAPFVRRSVVELPSLRVGLVLGCAEKTPDGRQNLYFERRIAAALELFRAGRVQYLLLSGDNSTEAYDEPSAMRRALLRGGVPASRLVLDYAGFRTLDSVVRAKRVFGADEAIIVSQRFHNERAVYLARAHGLRAFAFDAEDVGGVYGLRMAAREAVARLFAVLDVHVFHTEPRFAGPRKKSPFGPA